MPPAAGAGRCLRGAIEPGVLRELYRLDCGLVCGDAVPAGAGADVRGARTKRPSSSSAELVEDVDRKGTRLNGFFPAAVRSRADYRGASYVLVDFPRTVRRQAGSRAEEDAAGASRAYLVDYAAEDVINWSLDEQGNFEWVVIRTEAAQEGPRGRRGVADGDAVVVLRQAERSGFTSARRTADCGARWSWWMKGRTGWRS